MFSIWETISHTLFVLMHTPVYFWHLSRIKKKKINEQKQTWVRKKKKIAYKSKFLSSINIFISFRFLLK